jgi:hypothetical protein
MVHRDYGRVTDCDCRSKTEVGRAGIFDFEAAAAGDVALRV